jgi:aerobic carbon-monoxide dehydrogenase medium subunit
MRGTKIEPEVVRRAAQLAAEASDPSADLRGSVEYKRDLVRVLTVRALTRALEQARRGT